MGEFKFMDLLYSKYASPMDLMNLYLEQGRFGEFVTNIIELEHERKKAEEEKETDNRLWSMFIHSYVPEGTTFEKWKEDVLKRSKEQGKEQVKAHTKDENMTEQDIQNIMDKFFP